MRVWSLGIQGRRVFKVWGLRDYKKDMGGCQDYGPFLGTLNNRCSAILRDHNFDNHPYGQDRTGQEFHGCEARPSALD